MDKAKSNAKPNQKMQEVHDGTPKGMILERFKRIRSLPFRSLDLRSEFFVHHYLRNKRYLL